MNIKRITTVAAVATALSLPSAGWVEARPFEGDGTPSTSATCSNTHRRFLPGTPGAYPPRKASAIIGLERPGAGSKLAETQAAVAERCG